MKKYKIEITTTEGKKFIIESDSTPDTIYDSNLRCAMIRVGWTGTMIEASNVLFVHVIENEQPKAE